MCIKVHSLTLSLKLFPETGSPSHNFFVVKKTFKTCNPPDFIFYSCKLTNETFPHMM